MLDINAKLSTFRKMVWDEEKNKSENDLYNSTSVNSRLITDKRESLEKDLEKSIEDRRSFAKIKYNEQLSKIREEEKNNFYNHKNLLVDDLVNEIKKELLAYTKNESYKNNLSNEINNEFEKLNINPEDYIVYVKKDDLSYVDFPNVEIMEERYLGGFILKSKASDFQYNHTYLSRLKDREYEIGKAVYLMFESEANDESKN